MILDFWTEAYMGPGMPVGNRYYIGPFESAEKVNEFLGRIRESAPKTMFREGFSHPMFRSEVLESLPDGAWLYSLKDGLAVLKRLSNCNCHHDEVKVA